MYLKRCSLLKFDGWILQVCNVLIDTGPNFGSLTSLDTLMIFGGRSLIGGCFYVGKGQSMCTGFCYAVVYCNGFFSNICYNSSSVGLCKAN